MDKYRLKTEQERKEKSEFIRCLYKAVQKINPCIQRITYEVNEKGFEYAVFTIKGKSGNKPTVCKINITGDSLSAIYKDIAKIF